MLEVEEWPAVLSLCQQLPLDVHISRLYSVVTELRVEVLGSEHVLGPFMVLVFLFSLREYSLFCGPEVLVQPSWLTGTSPL